MASNSSATERTSESQRLAWDLTLHRVLSVSIAALGTVINLTTIVVIICRRLYQKNNFLFVLNFFVGNLLMSSLALPLLFVLSFSSPQKLHVICVISGYAYFSLSATLLIDMSLISLNRYIQIVQFNYYDKMFSTRNTWIMVAFAWLFYPTVLLFPLTGIWGKFTLDPQRLICSPMISNEEFRLFSLILVIAITAPIPFCYTGIIRKAISSGKRVNTTQSGNSERRKNEKKLIRSILVLITLSSVIQMPIVVSTKVDPKIELISPLFHCLFFYLGASMSLVNGLTESILNHQIKRCFLSIFKQILKRNKSNTSELADTAMDTF